MLRDEYVTKITPVGGGKPIEVTVLAGGPSEARDLIEEKHGPVRTWWYQPVEVKFLKNYKATIRRDNGGEVLDVAVRATGPQEAKLIIEHEHGPVRDWISIPSKEPESLSSPRITGQDLD
jgi:hypothetical protein